MAATTTNDVFCEIPCLTECSTSLSGLELQKKWFKGSDKRHLAEALQKFVSYNTDSFKFLDVSPNITGNDREVRLTFRTGPYVGTIPLRAPDTGKQIGDFVVAPRFVSHRDRFGDYLQILTLLEHRIEPQFIDSIPLTSGRNFRPPLYFEAALYVNELASFTRHAWRKFKSVQVTESHPSGRINWERYVEHEFDPRRRLMFPTRRSILSELHSEYQQLKYVYELAVAELETGGAPPRIKAAASNTVSYLNNRLSDIPAIETNEINVRLSDPPAVKSIKEAANRILQKDVQHGKAWRVDFSEVFERFVQHIFEQVAKKMGGVLFQNVRFRSKGVRMPVWALSHLEPDAVLQKDEHLFFIDAKYKAHLFNRSSDSEYLKEEYRHDLHQILAYSSFDTAEGKHAFLVYPSSTPVLESVEFGSPISPAKSRVDMIGVPLDVTCVETVQGLILQAIARDRHHLTKSDYLAT